MVQQFNIQQEPRNNKNGSKMSNLRHFFFRYFRPAVVIFYLFFSVVAIFAGVLVYVGMLERGIIPVGAVSNAFFLYFYVCVLCNRAEIFLRVKYYIQNNHGTAHVKLYEKWWLTFTVVLVVVDVVVYYLIICRSPGHPRRYCNMQEESCWTLLIVLFWIPSCSIWSLLMTCLNLQEAREMAIRITSGRWNNSPAAMIESRM